jgi:hypothetical protein
MRTTKRRLFELATTFRQALLDCPKDDFSDYQKKRLLNFPRQSCDVASMLLAHYLWDQGFQNVERVLGFLDPLDFKSSHVWLETEGWIIDLTAHQFPGVRDSIIFAKAKNSWHSKCDVQTRDPAHLDQTWARSEKAYAAVKKWLDGNRQPDSCP